MPSMLDMDEQTAPWQGTGRARRRLGFMPERAGVNISSILLDYNHFLGGVDQHDATLALWQDVHAVDVLR